MSLYSYAKVSSLSHATYTVGLKNCLLALYVMQRLAIASFVSSQPPYFRLIRKAVWGTMVTNNVCGSVILFISVQTKKGMSEDSTHRKPLLYLGA